MQLVDANHEGRYAGVVAELLDVLRNLLDELVDRLILLRRRLALVGQEFARALIVEQCPELLQEAVAAVYSVGVPRLALLYRTEEHLVETQRVGSVFVYNHVGVDNVEHRLRHLLYSPSAHILAVFEDEFGVVVFGAPCLECLCVEHIAVNNVYVNVYRCYVILVFQSETYKQRFL